MSIKKQSRCARALGFTPQLEMVSMANMPSSLAKDGQLGGVKENDDIVSC